MKTIVIFRRKLSGNLGMFIVYNTSATYIIDVKFHYKYTYYYLVFYTCLPFRETGIRKDAPRDLTDRPTIDHMSFDRISMSVNFLKERTKYRPKISIICGTGLGMLITKFIFWYLFFSNINGCEISKSYEIFDILQ